MTKPGGYFTIESGSRMGEQVTIEMDTRPVFVIGSDPRCDLQLTDDDLIAPAHVAIAYRDGVYYAKPRYITQPVMINGERIKKAARINSGDTLRVGRVSLIFHDSLFSLISQPAPQLAQLRGLQPASEEIAEKPKFKAKPARRNWSSHTSSNHYTGIIAIMVSALVLIVLVGFVAMDQINQAAPNSQYANYMPGSVTLVLFHADWCGYCQQQKPIVNNIGREFGDALTIVLVDIDDPNNYAEVDYYGAYNVPYMLILNEYGEVVYDFMGLTNADTLIAAIETILVESQPFIEPNDPDV